MWAMPLYATLPAITEWIVEQGWTRAYARIEDVGLRNYFLYFVMYMACVEFFVYCNHRGLHDVKIGYKCGSKCCPILLSFSIPCVAVCCCPLEKLGCILLSNLQNSNLPICLRWLHYIHHKYNKEHTMSPFAGLAFHALDGITQVSFFSAHVFYVYNPSASVPSVPAYSHPAAADSGLRNIVLEVFLTDLPMAGSLTPRGSWGQWMTWQQRHYLTSLFNLRGSRCPHRSQ